MDNDAGLAPAPSRGGAGLQLGSDELARMGCHGTVLLVSRPGKLL